MQNIYGAADLSSDPMYLYVGQDLKKLDLMELKYIFDKDIREILICNTSGNVA